MLRMFLAVILALATGLSGRRAVHGHQRHHRRHGQRRRARVLPGVTVTVTNLDTGDQRVVVTNESGLYRAPLLPLGTLPRRRGAAGLQEVRADRRDAVAPARPR